MPIYEFYCSDCHRIFNFFSKSVNTTKIPLCPTCNVRELEKMVSLFAPLSGAREGAAGGDDNIDAGKLEKAMALLAQEGEKIKEDDPRQAARFMEKLTEATGVRLNPKMEELLGRMEAGESPETLETEMSAIMGEEEPFTMGKKGGKHRKDEAPARDEKLYDL